MERLTCIVVGYHPSQASLRALAVAKDLGNRMDAQVHVVHGIDLDDYPNDPDAYDWEEQAAVVIEAGKETVETVMADYPGRWHYHALRGGSYGAICEIAGTVDTAMIVVGHRGDSFGHLGGLSLVRKLLNSSGYPVLVVTSRGHLS
jgi:nucleotide-binding universal stress UspA family protein